MAAVWKIPAWPAWITIQAMWDEGFNTHEIAEEMGLQEYVVYNTMAWLKGQL